MREVDLFPSTTRGVSPLAEGSSLNSWTTEVRTPTEGTKNPSAAITP